MRYSIAAIKSTYSKDLLGGNPVQSRIRSLAYLAIIFVLAAGTMFSQLDTGTITVTVKDASGSAMPGAKVLLRNENTSVEVRSGVTNDQGNVNFTLIPSGNYAVHVEMTGFK